MKKAKRIGSRGSLHAPPTNAFKPGCPPGPGRPKTNAELQEAFRDRTPKALAVLDKVLDGYLKAKPTVTARDAVKAAEVGLNRGWGSPPETVKLEGGLNLDVKTEARVEVATPLRLMRVAQVLMKAGALPAVTGEVAPVSSDEPKEEP